MRMTYTARPQRLGITRIRHIVLVTGSRTWARPMAVYRALEEIADRLGGEIPMAVMHGHCPRGADAYADRWARISGTENLRRPADWRQHGKGAGPIRNSEMVAEILAEVKDPQLCDALAFQDECEDWRCHRPRPHGTHGTADCIAKIRKAGFPLKVDGLAE